MKEYFIDRSYKASMGIANAVLVTLGIGLSFANNWADDRDFISCNGWRNW